MTSPNGDSPAGSLAVGAFAAWKAQTQDQAKASLKGVPLNAWGGAQANLHSDFTRQEATYREVTRLDNRIDEFATREGRVQIATFSTNATWTKPPGCYKVEVHVLGGASGGGRSNNGGTGGGYRGGVGGWSGGWSTATYDAGVVPMSVAVTIGAGGEGGNSDGENGSPGTGSAFGDLISAGGASHGSYGTGNYAFRIRGGDGATGQDSTIAQKGGAGSFDPGGDPDENGYSVAAANVGMGSGGGGGSGAPFSGNGYKGGDGGWPSAPGGGGGAYYTFGFAGNGGAGASAAVFVKSYIKDTAGNPPTAPTSVTASSITQSTATITWTASTDDVRVEKYIITLGSVEVGETFGTTYHLSQLSAETEYTVSIVAVDLGGNNSVPGPVTFTTLV